MAMGTAWCCSWDRGERLRRRKLIPFVSGDSVEMREQAEAW